MEIVAEMDARCASEELFEWVEDLSRYPRWLEIVTRAEPLADDSAPGDPAGVEPSWAVDLRGRIGPLARSKRLRMIRTRHDVPRSVRFERAELDGRTHSPWVLEADVGAIEGPEVGSRLTMRLSYGGGLFGPVLERVLRDEIERSRRRLAELVEQETAS